MAFIGQAFVLGLAATLVVAVAGGDLNSRADWRATLGPILGTGKHFSLQARLVVCFLAARRPCSR
jgi:hypothetical protein